MPCSCRAPGPQLETWSCREPHILESTYMVTLGIPRHQCSTAVLDVAFVLTLQTSCSPWRDSSLGKVLYMGRLAGKRRGITLLSYYGPGWRYCTLWALLLRCPREMSGQKVTSCVETCRGRFELGETCMCGVILCVLAKHKLYSVGVSVKHFFFPW